MTKIAVLSDTHGDRQNVYSVLELVKDCAYIVHLGDGEKDMERFNLGSRLLDVQGNCDLFSFLPLVRYAEIEGVKLMMTHGHISGVKSGLLRLQLTAQEKHASLVLYGHTHIQRCDQADDLIMLNPGSLRNSEYAIIELDKGNISYTFMHL